MPLPSWVPKMLNHAGLPFAWIAHSDTSQIPRPFAFQGLFRAEGPFGQSQPDVTWNHPEPCQIEEAVQIHLHIASRNVLTLGVGQKQHQLKGLFELGRIATLQRQFSEQQCHVIGLQECRTQGSQTRHSNSHYVYQSGAASDGSRGCEFWLDRTHPYATSRHRPFRFAHDHVHVASFSDRHMLVILKAPHLHIRFLVVHAPYAGAPDADYGEWWTEMTHLVATTCSNLPLVVLGDFNARLGSHTSDAVADFGREDETETGHCVHEFLLGHSLWAPASFDARHIGQRYTWMSTAGIPHRLAFICLPKTWNTFDILSQVLTDVDLATTRQGHFVVSMQVRMQVSQSTRSFRKRCRVDVRKCQGPEAKSKFADYLMQPPSLPWSLGSGEHAELLVEWIQQGAQQCFPKDRQLPKQRYMSGQTWHVVKLRKQLLKLQNASTKHCSQIFIRVVLRTWHRITLTSEDFARTLDDHNRWVYQADLIQRDCAQRFWWPLHQRRQLHGTARAMSRQDRIDSMQQIVDDFYAAAKGHDSRLLFRALKPLLGQTDRKQMTRFRPIPAVANLQGQFQPDAERAAECWRAHFAEPEQGRPVTVSDLQHEAFESFPCYADGSISFDLDTVPRLGDIEAFILQSRNHKSPGVDGLPAEVFKCHPSVFAKLLMPLFLKTSLRCDEPLRWKGGEVCALPKTSHARMQPDQFRSILLADYLSEVSHGLLRKRLLPQYDQYRLTMQGGGIPNMGTDLLHLYVQSYAQRCRQHSLSSAAIFIDIRQAFYRACRPLLVSGPIDDLILAQFSHQVGWSVELFQSFQDHLHAKDALQQAQVSDHQRAQVRSALHATWFQLRGNSKTLTATHAGTKPGDSIADLLYGFVMGRYLHQLRIKLTESNLQTTFDLQWLPFGIVQPDEFSPQAVIQGCRVDDLVLLLQSSQPQDL